MGLLPLSAVSQKPRDTWRGYFAYRMNAEAGGANSRGILAVWYAWITMESGKTIFGNNPLNITCSKGDGCYAGQIGYYHFAGNSLNFVAFDSPESAAKAYIGLLSRHPEYGYTKILDAARRDDWQSMITAIINSSWAGGHYGGANSSFWKVWNSVRSAVDADIASGKIGKAPAYTGGEAQSISTQVTSFLSSAGIDANATITQDSLRQYIHWYATKAHQGSSFESETYALLSSWVGKKWSDVAEKPIDWGPAPVDPIKVLGDLAQLLIRILDPANWVRIAALLLGALLAWIGITSILSATSTAVNAA